MLNSNLNNLIKIKLFENISSGADSLAALAIDTSKYSLVTVVSTNCYVASIMMGIGVISIRCENWAGESLPNANGLVFWVLYIEPN